MNAEQEERFERTGPARRVLVVDDHAGFRRCASTLLTAEGFEVVGEASDGAGAIALAAELGPSLVLLDVQLPDIDGFMVTERLLATDPSVQVVLVSSRDRDAYGGLIETCGARGFLSKGDLSGDALERLLLE